MSLFRCSTCGYSYSDSGNFTMCPNFFRHGEIAARRKAQADATAASDLLNATEGSSGLFPASSSEKASVKNGGAEGKQSQ